jgi:hypothetical protein
MLGIAANCARPGKRCTSTAALILALAAAADALGWFLPPARAWQGDPERGNTAPQPPYERLRPDSAWCAPRVLYFFADYYGQDATLSEVVKLCNSDAQGRTSMRDLVRAAEALSLEPEPIECSADQLLALRGPAIVCVGANPDTPSQQGAASGEAESRIVHFVAYLGREGNRVRIIDPSLSADMLHVSEQAMRRAYAGKAVLLKGCDSPWLMPPWYSLELAASLVLAASLLGAGIIFWRRRAPQRSASQQLVT